MKSSLFFLISLAATTAFANPEVPACDELELMYEYNNGDGAISERHRQQNNKNIEQAYQTLCKSVPNKGDTIIYPNGQVAVDSYNTEGMDIFYPNGEVMVRGFGGSDPVWFYPDARLASETPDELWYILSGAERKTAKIEAPFKAQHNVCAKNCKYTSWGIWGDLAHQKRKSCHNSGEAIDIHAITCGGVKHSGAKSSKFNSYVTCMRKKFTVLWKVKDHFNHAHIQIPNCKMIKLK